MKHLINTIILTLLFAPSQAQNHEFTLDSISEIQCRDSMSTDYRGENWYEGGGSGGRSGFKIYRDGQLIYSQGGIAGTFYDIHAMEFVTNSTGFLVYSTGSSLKMSVEYTNDFGLNWHKTGGEGGSYPNFENLFVVNEHFAYINFGHKIIKSSNLPGHRESLPKVDSLEDVYVHDTIVGEPLCSVDTLTYFYTHKNRQLTYNIVIHSKTASSQQLEIDEVQLFPNPSTEYFSLNKCEQPIQSIQLVSMRGEILKDFNVLDTRHDISDIPSGMYLVKFQMGTRTYFKKLGIRT